MTESANIQQPIPDEVLDELIRGEEPSAPVELTVDQRLQIEIAHQLRSINFKLVLFLAVLLIGIVLGLLGSFR
ncbi:MAG: hypothetical protein PHQ40_16860 [Anaerolineaceae bacterium]|nr:hypothetical protein [Anaerolineaceae bacterium]